MFAEQRLIQDLFTYLSSLEPPRSATTISCRISALVYGTIGLLGAVIAGPLLGIHWLALVFAVVMSALFGSYWALHGYLHNYAAHPYSHRWWLGWGTFLTWYGGLFYGAARVIPAGPQDYEVLQVFWTGFSWLFITFGLVGIGLEFLAELGLFRFEILADKPAEADAGPGSDSKKKVAPAK